MLKRCSFAEIDRQVTRARAAHDPAETERRRVAALERRHVRIGLDQATPDGLVPIEGWMEHADALALDTALQAIATTLDPSLSLDARRAVALGILADHTNGSASGSAREVCSTSTSVPTSPWSRSRRPAAASRSTTSATGVNVPARR